MSSSSTTTTTTPPSLAFFPEVVLLNVFSHLPLKDLLHIDEVCKTWIELKLEALKNRKHLYIVQSGDDLVHLEAPEYCSFELLQHVVEEDGVTPLVKRKVRLDRHAFSTGVGRQLTAEQLEKLVTLMPNVAVLRLIVKDAYFELWKTTDLLIRYQKQLVELTLWFISPTKLKYGGESYTQVGIRLKEQLTSMLFWLNSLPALRSLDLNLESPGPAIRIEVHLPIVRQLKTLKLRAEGLTNDFTPDSPMLRRLFADAEDASSSSLEELFIGKASITLRYAASLGPRLSSALRELDICRVSSFATLQQLATQCPHLVDLKVLLTFPLINIGPLAKALASCRALLHLKICASKMDDRSFPPPRDAAEEVEEAAGERRLPGPENQPELQQQQEQPPVVSSVKALSLSICEYSSHSVYARMNLAAIFPNVQVVSLLQERSSCQDCSIWDLDEDDLDTLPRRMPAYARRLLECFRLERASFRAFPKLSRLEVEVEKGYFISPSLQFICGRQSFTRENLDYVITYEELETNRMENEGGRGRRRRNRGGRRNRRGNRQ